MELDVASHSSAYPQLFICLTGMLMPERKREKEKGMKAAEGDRVGDCQETFAQKILGNLYKYCKTNQIIL